MYSVKKVIEINEVLFETNDDEVLVKGNIEQGHMKFSTELIISHTQLNQLINELKKINHFFDFSNLFKSEKMYNGETLYSALFSGELTRKIDLNLLSINAPLRQIRA